MLLRKIFALTLLISSINCSLVLAQENAQWEFAGWEGGGCYPNVEFDPVLPGRMYLTSDVAGIWRSEDNGETWNFANKGLGHLNVAAIAIAPTDSGYLYAATTGGVFVSRSGGNLWEPTKNLGDLLKFQRPQSYKPLAVSPLNANHLCVGSSKGKVFCSVDGGGKWKDLDPDRAYFVSDKPIAAVLFDSPGQNLWVGGPDGLFSYNFAENSVKSYPESTKNITDMVLLWDDKTIYAVGYGIISVYYEGKEIEYPTSSKISPEAYRIAIKSDLESDKPRYEVIAAANRGWDGRILKSEDHGQNWKHVITDIQPDEKADPTWAWANPNGKMTGLKISPHDQNILFMTNWWGIFRSDDGGTTWVEKIRGAPNTVGSDIKVTAEAVWVATMDNGLLKSSDSGKSYATVFPFDKYDPARAGHVWRMVFPDENTVVATSSPWNEKVNQVIVSTDGGKNFQIVRDGLPEGRPKENTVWGEGYPRAIAVDPANPKRIYLGIDGDDGGGLFISDDSGLTWVRSEGQPGSLRIYNALVVDPTDPKRIFWGATGKGGGVYVSPDAGATWKHALTEMDWVFDLAIAPSGKIFAAGSFNGTSVFISDTKGEFWEKVNLAKDGAAEALAIDPSNEKRIAVSQVFWGSKAGGKIFISDNGGTDWKNVTANLPVGAGAAAMAFSPDGQYLYVSLYAGSVYRLKLQ